MCAHCSDVPQCDIAQACGDSRPNCSVVLRLLSGDLTWNRGEHMTWDLGEQSRVLDDGGLVVAWFLRNVLRNVLRICLLQWFLLLLSIGLV